jgi:hypothetical protein
MNDDVDVRAAIAPKSDQLNADDLIGATKDITITAVKRGSAEQPIVIHYDGEDGRPYKPCKTMTRVMVGCWGDSPGDWVGKTLRLYNDPEVTFGRAKVGGIRISHASHIDAAMVFNLTTTRSKRANYRVEPLEIQWYSADDFAANFPAWEKAIKAGNTTAEKVIAKVAQKGRLTDEQQQQIRAAEQPEQPGEPQQPADSGGGF